MFRWRLRRYKASRGLSIFRRSERMIRYNHQRGRGHQNVANALAKSSRQRPHPGAACTKTTSPPLELNFLPITDQHAVIRRLKPESSSPVTAEGFSARRVWSDVVGTKLDAKAAVPIVLDRDGGLHAGFGRTVAPKIAAQLRIRLISTPRAHLKSTSCCRRRSKPSLTPTNREVGPMLECVRIAFSTLLSRPSLEIYLRTNTRSTLTTLPYACAFLSM